MGRHYRGRRVCHGYQYDEHSSFKTFFYIGFLLAAFTGFNLVGFGALGLCLALLYQQVMQQRNQMQPAGVPAATGSEQVYDDDDDDLDA